MMTIKSRILTIRLTEKLDRKPLYSERLGLDARLQRRGPAEDSGTTEDVEKICRRRVLVLGK